MGTDEPLDLRRRGQHDYSRGAARRRVGWPSPARINLRAASRTGGRSLSQSESRSQQGQLGMRAGMRPQRPVALNLARWPSPVVVPRRALRPRRGHLCHPRNHHPSYGEARRESTEHRGAGRPCNLSGRRRVPMQAPERGLLPALVILGAAWPFIAARVRTSTSNCLPGATWPTWLGIAACP
jgi:hypothetical protein